jgi:hypothetical protein
MRILTIIYNKSTYLAEKTHALDQWAAHLVSLVTPQQGNSREISGEITSQLLSGTQS